VGQTITHSVPEREAKKRPRPDGWRRWKENQAKRLVELFFLLLSDLFAGFLVDNFHRLAPTPSEFLLPKRISPQSQVQGAIDRLEEGHTVICVAHPLHKPGSRAIERTTF